MPPLTPQRTRLSIKQKIKIIEDSKKVGFDKKKTMETYGISRTGLITLLKNQTQILKAADSGSINENVKSIKKSPLEQLECKLYDWLCDLSESRINLHNQEICESCDENLVGTFKCHDCNDILCKKCYKAHSRLKVTKTHVVTPL